MTRLLDKLLSLVALVAAAPFLGIAALLIRKSSPGPVLYRAPRAGRDGHRFEMYKLRTMHANPNPNVGIRITAGADDRIFAAGAFLRRIKLDEVPQLINVLRGEMSLVGPRPEDHSLVLQHYDEFMLESLTVLPGMTGPGSLDYFNGEANLPTDPGLVEQVYVESLLPRKIALDLVYVRHGNLSYYLAIIARTVLNILGLRGPFAQQAAWEQRQAADILAERKVSR